MKVAEGFEEHVLASDVLLEELGEDYGRRGGRGLG